MPRLLFCFNLQHKDFCLSSAEGEEERRAQGSNERPVIVAQRDKVGNATFHRLFLEPIRVVLLLPHRTIHYWGSSVQDDWTVGNTKKKE